MSAETPATIGKWIEETFPGGDPTSPRKSIRLLEEVFELCLACGATYAELINSVDEFCLKDWRKRDPNATSGSLLASPAEPRPDEVPAEAADTYVVLCGVAALRGFDLEAAVDRKMVINRGRTWRACGDGTGYHVKQEGPTP